MADSTATAPDRRVPRPARSTFLPYSPPWLGQEEIDEVVDTLKSDWITTGPKTRAFEAQFGAYVGAPGGTSLMVASCTDALQVALAALGVGPGDEVIVPTLTFAATANVVEHLGATTVLVDVLPDTLCIDPAAVEAALTPRTKVVVPVHYAGHPVELDALDTLAAKHGFAILEDAAHSAPSSYKGTKIGSRPTLTAFSFYPTKNLTTAEGGALTGDPALVDRARVLSLHGMSKDAWKRFDKAGSWEYDVVAPGYKANMTDLQSSLGMHQLRKLEGFHRRRQQIARRYTDAFAGVAALQTPTELPHVVSSWHMYVLRLRPEHLTIDRNRFIEELKVRQIGTSVHYRPLHMMSYYAGKYGHAPEAFPVAHDAFTRMLSIPPFPRMSDDDQLDVIDAVLDLVETHAA
jgi:dTDP-4-amino-4,6-dideoxygalactose transaminase